MTKPLRILGFRAEGIKRLSIVEITPDGNVIEITGENGNGKTSILDAIWWAIEGTKNIQVEPINQHQDKALIRLKIGGDEVKYIVTRKFVRIENPQPDGKTYRSTLTVTTPEGAKFGNPQEVLDTLIGALAFDPLAFIREKPERQFEILKAFVPGFDFAANARLRKGTFDERTDVNRDAKQLWAQAGAITIPADAPEERVDEDALIAELEGAAETNANIDRAIAARAEVRRSADMCDENATRLDAEADELEERVKRLRAQAEEARGAAKAHRARADEADEKEPIPEKVDASEVRTRLEEARQSNAIFARVAEKKRLTDLANAKEAESKSLTARIEELDAARVEAVANAEMPVEGLGFGDEIVLFGGVPLSQASDAEQLRVSVAIAAAMNPTLRVIRIRDGSLLDRKSFTLLSDFAAEHDLQLWVETVDSGRETAIVITDGHVEGVDPETLKEPEPEEKPAMQVRQARRARPRAAEQTEDPTEQQAARDDLFAGQGEED